MTIDREALRSLWAASSPQTEHELVHYLYFPTQAAAAQAAQQLRAEGLAVVERKGALGDKWLARAKHRLVLTEGAVSAVRARLEQLATEGSGEYDGWEAKVVEA